MLDYATSRRTFLQASAGAAAAVAAQGASGEAARANRAPKAKQVIFLFMSGGPGQLDTFDLKTKADTSMVLPITTTVPDIQISQLFPEFAKQVHHAAIIRSLTTKVPDHALGRYYTHTGYRATTGLVHPSIGSVVAKELGDPESAVPAFVQVGPVFGKVDGDEPVSRYNFYGAGYLGPRYQPLVVKDPVKGLEDLKPLVGDENFRRRVALLGAMEHDFKATRRQHLAEAHAVTTERAVRLMDSDAVKAFSLADEPAKSRERYGSTQFGDACLMARRLIEADVPFVEVGFTGWDTHGNALKRHEILCADTDPALSALVTDLHERGRLESTLIVWMGEMGRTLPKKNKDMRPSGTDHWGKAMVGLLIGGGIAGGVAIGRTDATGQEVEDRPVTMQDFHATIYSALGIDYTKEYMSPGDRPLPMVNNQTEPEPSPLVELFG